MFNLNINGTIKKLIERSNKRYRYFLEWHGTDNDSTYQGYITFDCVVDLGNQNYRLLDVIYNLVYEGYFSGENKVCTIPFTIKFIGEGGTTTYSVLAWRISNSIWTDGQEGMSIEPVVMYYDDHNDSNHTVHSIRGVASMWIPLHGNAYDTDDASFKYSEVYPERGYPDNN